MLERPSSVAGAAFRLSIKNTTSQAFQAALSLSGHEVN